MPVHVRQHTTSTAADDCMQTAGANDGCTALAALMLFDAQPGNMGVPDTSSGCTSSTPRSASSTNKPPVLLTTKKVFQTLVPCRTMQHKHKHSCQL
jgi:hypothetical protein